MPSHDLFCGEKDPPPAGVPQSSSVGRTDTTGSPRIVIIEDEFFVAWGLQAMLRDLDYGSCEIASDAISGVDLAIAQEAELVLVDMNLGSGPDGAEAVRRIQQYRDVAAIFLTAYSDEVNLARIRQVAPHAPVLSKPVSAEVLFSTIRSLFPLA